MDPPRTYNFQAYNALLLEDSDDKPHVGAVVLDSTEAKEGKVLRSEVAVGIGLLKYQFRRRDFLRHHTLPVSPLPSIDLFYFPSWSPQLTLLQPASLVHRPFLAT